MAFSPCLEKSLSNAQITASLSLLRELRIRPAGLPADKRSDPVGIIASIRQQTANKERTTVASPTVPLEKTPAAALGDTRPKRYRQFEHSVCPCPGGVALVLADHSV
jgi:hypothetical protein